MNKIPVFVSFDVEHDRDLYELLLEQSNTPTSSFAVSASSEQPTGTEVWSNRVRREVAGASQVIVICGENTKGSTGVTAELAAAQDAEKPYLLLWGRRESMCTKPDGAKSVDGMYSWTQQLVHDQLALSIRKEGAAAKAKALRDATRKSQPDWTR